MNLAKLRKFQSLFLLEFSTLPLYPPHTHTLSPLQLESNHMDVRSVVVLKTSMLLGPWSVLFLIMFFFFVALIAYCLPSLHILASLFPTSLPSLLNELLGYFSATKFPFSVVMVLFLFAWQDYCIHIICKPRLCCNLQFSCLSL